MSLISKYKQHAKNSEDTEIQQALLRVVIVATTFVYSGFHYLFGEINPDIFRLAVFANVFSIGLLAHIFYSPAKNIPRRIVGLIHDPLVLTFFLIGGHEKAAVYFFAYTWVAIGNGFRYNVKYLYASSSLTAACLTYLFFKDSYWSQHYYFGLGILVLNIAVAGYTGFLLGKLNEAKNSLQLMATHDPLTGLANRRLLTDRLMHTLVLGQRSEKSIGVVYFDLDGFKKINDTLGHKVGDDLLKCVAVAVRGCIRDTDTFARLGGDEFVIILESIAAHEDARIVARRILSRIESIKEINGQPIHISASLGVLEHSIVNKPIAQTEPDNLIKIADEAMYRAKKSGKGRIEYATDHQPQRTAS